MSWLRGGAVAVGLAAAASALAFLPGEPADVSTSRPVTLVSLTGTSAGGSGSAIGRGDGPGIRLLTDGFWSAESPSASFDGRWFLFTGRRAPGSPAAIHRLNVDGSGLRAITAGAGEPGEPILASGDRIVFTDRAPEADGGRALYACALDGSGLLRLTFGPHRDGSPRFLDDGRIRFERTLLAGPLAGRRLMLTVHPDGTNVSPVPGPEADRDDEAEPDAARVVAASRLAEGAPREMGRLTVTPRPAPPVLTSIVNEQRRTGTLLCLNVRDSALPSVAAIPPGAIASVRARRVGGGNGDLAEVVGEAPVHADGSFLMELPADTLVGLTLIGDDGSELASFHTGVWVRPNENRGCIGCHEDRGRAPANRRPMALLSRPPSAGVVYERR